MPEARPLSTDKTCHSKHRHFDADWMQTAADHETFLVLSEDHDEADGLMSVGGLLPQHIRNIISRDLPVSSFIFRKTLVPCEMLLDPSLMTIKQTSVEGHRRDQRPSDQI